MAVPDLKKSHPDEIMLNLIKKSRYKFLINLNFLTNKSNLQFEFFILLFSALCHVTIETVE